jgi:hypothetical protein
MRTHSKRSLLRLARSPPPRALARSFFLPVSFSRQSKENVLELSSFVSESVIRDKAQGEVFSKRAARCATQKPTRGAQHPLAALPLFSSTASRHRRETQQQQRPAAGKRNVADGSILGSCLRDYI